MEQSIKEEEECGICLDALTNPVALPCSHKFCSECLNGWRSKYGMMAHKSGEDKMDRKCPLCREKIPPSKEMVAQLKFWQWRKSDLEGKGDIFSQEYTNAKNQVEAFEREVGDCLETIEYSDEEKSVMLPTDISKVATKGNIQKVLAWLGPLPVDKHRVNAKNPEIMDATLVHCAVMGKNSDLLSILLQLGADVDPVAYGGTPLSMNCCEPQYYSQARLMLEWGAEISNSALCGSKDDIVEYVVRGGNSKLANLMKSEFGGRRCEVINLPNRPDLIGKTCVVEKYLPDKGRYKVIFEMSKEVGLVGPENLKRRDRTPNDCGYYITYENGRTSRRDFASREECQAFVASLTEEDAKAEARAGAEARAEQAAQSLLAELEIDSSVDSDRMSKKGKGRQKKGKKKKGRK